MKSKIIESKYAGMVKLCRQMTPEERLVAFLNHSQSIARIRQAGERFRSHAHNQHRK
jgi:hypothetical protein